MVANVDAAAVTSGAGLRERLGRQMVSAVRWTESVQRLVELGAEVLVEVGPGEVLTGLARRIAPGVRAVSVGSLAAAAGPGRDAGRGELPVSRPAPCSPSERATEP